MDKRKIQAARTPLWRLECLSMIVLFVLCMFGTLIREFDERGATSTTDGMLSKRNTVGRTVVMGARRRRLRQLRCSDRQTRWPTERTNISSDSGKLIVRLTAGRRLQFGALSPTNNGCVISPRCYYCCWCGRGCWCCVNSVHHQHRAAISCDCIKLCIAYAALRRASEPVSGMRNSAVIHFVCFIYKSFATYKATVCRLMSLLTYVKRIVLWLSDSVLKCSRASVSLCLNPLRPTVAIWIQL